MQIQHPVNVRRFGGHSPVIGARVFIDPSAVVIGDVALGDDASVWPQVSVRVMYTGSGWGQNQCTGWLCFTSPTPGHSTSTAGR